MENIQITLNKGKTIHSTNVDNYIGVDLCSNDKILINTDLQSTIDEYQQYIKEKDSSNKYRLIFTINPICSNVLFNRITELVYGEGSDNCELITNVNSKYVSKNDYVSRFKKDLNEIHEITTRDTGLSYNKNYKYNCGVDIFNNHNLRRLDFVIINKQNGKTQYFNTIFDVLRDRNGNQEKGLINPSESNESNLHLYDKTNILNVMSSTIIDDFGKILDYSLVEKNGWFGFYNKSTVPIKQDNNFVINKVMLNRQECDFIDLYPDRTLFSFVPKWNDYRKRPEYNWNYYLTYPYENVYDHDLVVSGITGSFDDGDDNEIIYDNSDGLFNLETSNIRIRTNISHNLEKGSFVYLTIKLSVNNKTKFYDIKYPIRVTSVGKYNYDSKHYFSIDFSDISSFMRDFYSNNTGVIKSEIFIKKYVNGRSCKYYIRKFKRIPNFKNTKYSNLNEINDIIIDDILKTNDFNSSVNKLAFSKNIYGDDLSQIIFNDEIDTTGLRDNLGRELTTIYLTIIKNNAGYDKWYNSDSNKRKSSDVEYSHCFGKLTSGFDMPIYTRDYNVHCLHNIGGTNKTTNGGFNSWNKYPTSGNTIESNITKSDLVFYGDIVEFDEESLTETVLETIQHRFNTAQRETNMDVFSAVTLDSIEEDDYDGSSFDPTVLSLMGSKLRGNIAPEGYYYQAHHPIKIREFEDGVNEGFHTFVNVLNPTKIFDNYAKITGVKLDKNYYFNVGDEVYLYNINNNKKYVGNISSISDDYETISISNIYDLNGVKIKFRDEIGDYKLYKPNPLKPTTAYDFNDGTGKYVWKNIKSFEIVNYDSELYDSTFTNGCHYLHKQINFYLKRQDPFGEYGLQPSNNNFGTTTEVYSCVEITGEYKDITQGEVIEPGTCDCLKF
jgi:hypothetical protein